MIDYTRDSLNKMGIYELRGFARRVGVYSPTTLKKEQIIDKIISIIAGTEKPLAKQSKQGRPPKSIASLDDMLSMFLPKEILEGADEKAIKMFNSERPFQDNCNCLMANTKNPVQNMQFDGYFELISEKYGVVYNKGYQSNFSKQNYYVLQKLIDENNLKNGDFLTGKCNLIQQNNILVVAEIDTINQIAVEQLKQRNNIEELTPIYPTTILSLKKEDNLIDFKLIDKICPMAKGARIVLNYEDNNLDIRYFIGLLNGISVYNDIKTLAISINDYPEDIGAIKRECPFVEFCQFSATINYKQYFEMLFLKIENFCRRLEHKEDVSIVFINIEKLIDAYKDKLITCDKLSEVEAKIVAENKFRDIFALAQNSSEGGSLTILAFNNKLSEIEELSNCFIKINEKSYPETDIKLNIFLSKTKNVKNLLEPLEYDKLTAFQAEVNESNKLEQINKLFD